MAHQRPMSTPIFDELLREFASRMEEQRAAAPPESAEPAAQPQNQANQPTHRHRAE